MNICVLSSICLLWTATNSLETGVRIHLEKSGAFNSEVHDVIRELLKLSNRNLKRDVVKCGREQPYTSPGTLSSPNYKETVNVNSVSDSSSDYPNNADCTWKIIAPVNKYIHIEFKKRFVIEPHKECKFDYLTITNDRGGNNVIDKFCGDKRPAPITIPSNRATVRFHSDEIYNKAGFAFTFTFVPNSALEKNRVEGTGAKQYPGCNTKPDLHVAASGVIMSPNYGQGNYPENSDCQYFIRASSNQIIELKFEAVDIEFEASCLYDGLAIYDGPNQTAPLFQDKTICGKSAPNDFVSTGNTVYLKFTSDYIYSFKGFKINYQMKASTTIKVAPGCNGQPYRLKEPTGELTSPNFGDGLLYPDNAFCQWIVSAPQNMVVHIHFVKFNVEFQANCLYDNVKIYNGVSNTSKLVASLCGENNPPDLTVEDNEVMIQFSSDYIMQRSGFQLQYSSKQNMNEACGIPDVLGKAGRIVGGQEAIPHAWPWMVSLRYRNWGWNHWCGASIISDRWLITAAHCTHGRGGALNFRAKIGDHSWNAKEELEVDIDTEQILEHENYNTRNFDNDIAIIKLKSPIAFNKAAKTICLPDNDVQDFSLTVATGWGATQGTLDQSKLNQVNLPVLSRTTCTRFDFWGALITNNMFCAGYPEGIKDSCQGDSGGPLAGLGPDGRYILYGLTSWGPSRCAIPKKPGVYTRVTRYRDWIAKHTGVTSVR